jgi:DHA2 family multidrug resistance protein
MIPGSQSLLMAIFPQSKRGFGLGLWSMTTLVAPVAGPLLGGYISDNYSWPWIFLINLPIGLLSAAVCWGILKDKDTPTRKVPVDVIGLALLVTWVGALQVMLDTGKDQDWFESTQIVMLAIVAAIGFCAFLIWERGDDHPIVDLSFFRLHNYRLGMAVSCLGYAVFFGNVVILPLWLQTQLGYTATWAGIVQSPSGMVAVLLSPYVGRRLQDYDARRLATFALVAMAISLYMRALLNSQAAIGDFILPMLVQGVGLSFFFVSVMTIQYDGISPQRLPAAAGLANFLRITAGSFSTSIAATIWEDRAALHQSRLAEASSAYDPTVQNAMASLQGAGMGTQQSIGVMTRGAIEQSFMLSSLDYFWVSTWILLALVGLVWLARRPHMGGPVPIAAD